jgi:CubicO group peptidase (beta-lactamase class C family)
MKNGGVDAVVAQALVRGEVGLQVSAHRNGAAVAEVCAGVTRRGGDVPVDASTLFPIFSVSKAVLAVALQLQAERGLVDVDAPVVELWPEYGANGKAATTVVDVLTHRAGLPQVPEGATMALMARWDWMVDRLAQAAPRFPPGTTSAYHSLTWGWLVGEIVRRSDGRRRTLGRFLAEDICAPLGVTDLHLGVPAEALPRVAELCSDETRGVETDPLRLAVKPPRVALTPEIYNRASTLTGEHPGTGMVACAAAVARVFAMLAAGGTLDGVRLLSTERVRAMLTPRRDGDEVDRVQGRAARISTAGLWLSGGSASDDAVTGGGAAVLYHPGQGGSLAWADLDTGVAVAICHNRMFDLRIDPARHPYAGLGAAVAAA